MERMKGHNHFVTGDFKSHAARMGDKEYAGVLDNVVITCVDCILVNEKGEMLLGKRTCEPQPDWWIIGGRMVPGESFEEAARRNVKRELNLDIKPSRFRYFGTYSLVWARRAQAPQDNGCHTVSITMIVTVFNEEVAKIEANDEYEKLKWYNPEIVMESENFHPTVVTYAMGVISWLERTRR